MQTLTGALANEWLENHHRRVKELSYKDCTFCEQPKSVYFIEENKIFCSYECYKYWKQMVNNA